jgi:hypothetical protein
MALVLPGQFPLPPLPPIFPILWFTGFAAVFWALVAWWVWG